MALLNGNVSAESTTPLRHIIYSSVMQAPQEQWDALTKDEKDLTMDRRLIAAFEATMPDCRCFTIMVENSSGGAAGVACAWVMRLDLANFPWLTKPVTAMRTVWPNCLRMGILFCGLPVPSGQNHLRIAADADRDAVLEQLHRALLELAKAQRAKIVVLQEFTRGQADDYGLLERLGYLCREVPPLHVLDSAFGSFAGYREALKARYRSQVNRSLKKFEAGGFRVEHVRGPDDLPKRYTDEVHQLYHAVWERSPYRAEHLSAEFMRELGRTFGDDASLTCIYQGDHLAGFTIGLARGTIYHNLYSGIDYELNGAGDIYFNLFYHDLDLAWQNGAAEVHLGQTSDDFKSRLGSRTEAMFLFIRPPGAIMRWGLRTFSKWAFPAVGKVEAHDVFKSPSQRRSRCV